MRVLIQRVKEAKVTIEDLSVTGSIDQGLLVLLGIESDDQQEDIDYLISKILQLRIFNDEQGVMNKSVSDIRGEILLVSQFTLQASTKQGNRPSYIKAAKPEIAIPLYLKFIDQLRLSNLNIQTGIFGAMMQVQLINDGPVTIWMDSKIKDY
ncbi:MAG: D-aminoacyl-tRNA deacylase [Saprospiraceae bacterium]